MSQKTSGDFGAGGDQIQSVEMTFHGFLGASFMTFLKERARRLSLEVWVRSDPDRVTLRAKGPEAMLGCLEISCSLGPIDTDVLDWSCVERPDEGDVSAFKKIGASRADLDQSSTTKSF